MNIGSKRPSHISIENIHEFEKNGWGKISFEEFIRDKNV